MTMANSDVSNGAKKLKERILADAQAQAQETAQQAQAQCDAIMRAGEKHINDIHLEDARKLKAEIAAVMDRSRTNAELEARKAALAARRKIIDEAFLKAYDALCAMDDEMRAKVITNTLLNETDGGETLLCASAERALVEKMLPQVQQTLQAQGKATLVLSDETADIEHGFILIGKGYEKNCSFKALLEDMRAAQETKVAGILFE